MLFLFIILFWRYSTQKTHGCVGNFFECMVFF